MARKKYTYIPKEEIASITTFNNVDFENEDILDGAYVKGRKKYGEGGSIDSDIQQKINKLYLYTINEVDLEELEERGISKNDLDNLSDKELKNKVCKAYGWVLEKDNVWSNETRNQYLREKVLQSYYDTFGDDDMMARGGRTKSAIMRDRAYRSNEPHELKYKRKNRPKNPRYQSRYCWGGRMADGGIVSLEQQAQSLVGSDWFQLNKNDQNELVSQFVADGVIGVMFAKGGGVAEAGVEVKFTLANGKIVTKSFANQSEADEGIAEFYMDNDVEDVAIIVKEEAKPKKSLFKMAEEEPKATKSKSKDKPEVRVDGIEGDIAEYDRINQKIKMLQTEKEVLAAKLKDVGKEKYIELYELKNRKPENFNLADGDEEILYMVQDKYIKVTPEKAALLRSYGKGLVETVTTYEFDKDVVEKKVGDTTVGDIVSELIMESTDIPDEYKTKLIKATVETRVPKGTIDRLLEYPNPEEVFNLIEPIQALK